MPFRDSAHYFTGGHVEGGKQTGRSVAFVIVGSALDLPGFELKHGLGSVQSLNLSFFVYRQNQSVVGRVPWYRPTTSITFSAKSGSLLILKERIRWGLRSAAFQISVT